MLLISLYAPRKHQKRSDLVMSSGGIEKNQQDRRNTRANLLYNIFADRNVLKLCQHIFYINSTTECCEKIYFAVHFLPSYKNHVGRYAL